jgi:hypothetical protein
LLGSSKPNVTSRRCLDDLLAHLFGVAEQHHCVVAIEQLVLESGIAIAGLGSRFALLAGRLRRLARLAAADALDRAPRNRARRRRRPERLDASERYGPEIGNGRSEARCIGSL